MVMIWLLTIWFNKDTRILEEERTAHPPQQSLTRKDIKCDTEDDAWEALRCFMNEELTKYPSLNPLPAIYDELDGEMDENSLLRKGCSRTGITNVARYVSYDTCDYCEDCGEFFCPCTDLGNLRWEYRIREGEFTLIS